MLHFPEDFVDTPDPCTLLKYLYIRNIAFPNWLYNGSNHDKVTICCLALLPLPMQYQRIQALQWIYVCDRHTVSKAPSLFWSPTRIWNHQWFTMYNTQHTEISGHQMVWTTYITQTSKQLMTHTAAYVLHHEECLWVRVQKLFLGPGHAVCL